MNNLPTQNQKGAAMIEYALLVVLIMTVCITSVTVIGGRSAMAYTRTNQAMAAAFGEGTGEDGN